MLEVGPSHAPGTCGRSHDPADQEPLRVVHRRQPPALPPPQQSFAHTRSPNRDRLEQLGVVIAGHGPIVREIER